VWTDEGKGRSSAKGKAREGQRVLVLSSDQTSAWPKGNGATLVGRKTEAVIGEVQERGNFRQSTHLDTVSWGKGHKGTETSKKGRPETRGQASPIIRRPNDYQQLQGQRHTWNTERCQSDTESNSSEGGFKQAEKNGGGADRPTPDDWLGNGKDSPESK